MAKYVADDFMRVVPLIRAKHPDIYDKEKRFFRRKLIILILTNYLNIYFRDRETNHDLAEPVAEVVSEEENSHGKKEVRIVLINNNALIFLFA